MYMLQDRIHGEINLPNYTREIIASETFQRLRNLKQLGVSNYYYKNATHTRFEHCIGTAHLARTLLDTLENNSNVKIDAVKRKCVILGALMVSIKIITHYQ
jgi:HD superfamily phosphohydrolase